MALSLQSRRQFVTLAIAAAGLASGALQAQTAYPTKTISVVVPTATGGTTDLAARLISQPLAAALGQSVVVENKGGANGTIGAMAVKKSTADGYTLFMQYSGYHVITPYVSSAPLPWNTDDFVPIANVISAPQVIVVRADLPIKSMAELVAYAKANPGKLNYASSGNGSLQHVTGAMLEQQTGIKMTHVPYKGTGPALTDLVGGQVDLTFGTPPPFVPHIQSGKLRAIAVTSKKRLPSMPDVPTTAEAGMPKLNPTSWFALFAPAKTPKPVIDKLTAEVGKILATPAIKQKAIDLGAEADYMNPKELAEMVKQEQVRWQAVVKSANIKAD